MDLETYKATFSEEDTPGWAAIDDKLAEIYGGGEPDFHFGTIIKFALGGPDPIDGVSVYKRLEPSPHLHYVGYGMSSLYYDEEAAGGEFSKWGSSSRSGSPWRRTTCPPETRTCRSGRSA